MGSKNEREWELNIIIIRYTHIEEIWKSRDVKKIKEKGKIWKTIVKADILNQSINKTNYIDHSTTLLRRVGNKHITRYEY